jgi:hypothetical protein
MTTLERYGFSLHREWSPIIGRYYWITTHVTGGRIGSARFKASARATAMLHIKRLRREEIR